MNTTNPTKNRGWRQMPERIGSSCSTSDACHVTLISNQVISHAWGKKWLWLWQMEHICGNWRPQHFQCDDSNLILWHGKWQNPLQITGSMSSSHTCLVDGISYRNYVCIGDFFKTNFDFFFLILHPNMQCNGLRK